MLKFFYSILLFLYSTTCSYGQLLYDNNWFFGYDNNIDTTDKYGITMLNFNSGNLKISQNTALECSFNSTETTISDSTGQLILYSNGVSIYNEQHYIMEGGSSVMDGYEDGGSVWNQYAITIPWPGNPNKFLVFYQEYAGLGGADIAAKGLYYAVVDPTLNIGAGKVLSPRNIIIEDTLWLGHVIPVRHANGRDWWLLMNEYNTNKYYRILIDPEGIHNKEQQSIGEIIHQGDGQSVFSPNGEHFCSYNSISQAVGSYLDIYDFDRCTGLLSNHRQLHQNRGWGGVAISPNSRYLYHNFQLEVYQYDLEASDVLASRVKIADWDGTQSPFPTSFYTMQLAPDGKIYSATSTNTNVLHVIHQPDESGILCQYEQHGVQMPTLNAFTMPNFPNYRLGPLDGSSCDTLGLDNSPVAWFRYQRDTLDSLSVLFHDLSYYEPSTWSWDFGDGTPLSAERHPAHTYAQAGAYEVCLTVSNANATNTFCRKLFLGITAAEDPDIQASISVFPNPFNARLGVAESGALRGGLFRLFDLSGRLKRETSLVPGIREIDTGDLAAGMYFWEVRVKGERIASGKLVKNIE